MFSSFADTNIKSETATKTAVKEASNTARHWGAPVNREARSEGGYHWSTYKVRYSDQTFQNVKQE